MASTPRWVYRFDELAWCPSTRDARLESPIPIGVYVQGRRNWITNFFPGDGIDHDADTIMSPVPADC